MARRHQQEYDVIVIGSGPAGEGAAMGCAKTGRQVALVERGKEVGGGCTHWGTIPSKALRHAVQTVLDFRRNPIFSGINDHKRFEFPALLKSADSVIRKQVSMRRNFYLRNEVSVVHGFARFLDDHTVAVEEEEGHTIELSAKHVVIATGSRPYRPDSMDFSHPRVRDSDSILQLDHTPGTITIFGAGVIGCEYASIFRNLGVKVNLINGRDKLLSFLDCEISDALAYHLRDQGVILRNNEALAAVDASESHAILHLKSGKQLKSDIVLWAQGRSGNTQGLSLDAIGVEPDKRGHIQVDKSYRVVGKEHVYAVGDVVGHPGLASASYDQGRFAACHIEDPSCDLRLVENIPTGIYTSPEISSVGRSEQELTSEGVPYEVGHALFRSLARAQITGHNVGMLKLLFHRETLQLLGIHCFGDQAAEIVHIGQAIMAQDGAANSIEYFVRTTFNYPTMAEAYRVAALNGLNRLC